MRPLRLAFLFLSLTWFLLLAFASSAQEAAGQPARPPQTARQALIEMFTGKGAHAFEKHLPEAARHALLHNGNAPENSEVQRIIGFLRQMSAMGEQLQTFDEGGILLSLAESNEQKIDVVVEGDSVAGEEEQIELSLQLYKDGQLQQLPVVPRLTFSMKQEKEVWRLSEMALALRVPLTDSEYLKGLRNQQNENEERMAAARINALVASESEYAGQHPERGYTCNLTELEADQGDSEGLAAASADSEGAAESNGYRMALTACAGSPVFKFQITLVPSESDSGMKAYCADESGVVRFSADGKGKSCLSRGAPVN